MFIPLSDKEPNRYSGFSSVTLVLIGLNVLIYAYEEALAVSAPENLYFLFYFFGVVPKWIWAQQGLGAVSAITVAFLHGGMAHLLGNMLFLWAFGRRVEDACGRWRFLCFYLLCSVTATLAHVIIHSQGELPGIGASGAVSGVMAAYLILYPWGRINTIFFPLPIRFSVRAFWLLIYFLIISNVIPALQVLFSQADFQVAYWAHLGGLIGGTSIFLFMRPEAIYRFWRQDSV
ncbi:MAG: rhomboid family intramembrane serine protease [Anaerolineae bacterium]|nr:rhomboid family intramembrane serine protease [Anaerolineae bacterium]